MEEGTLNSHHKEQPDLLSNARKPLHAVLKASFGNYPTGHCVVFLTTIPDVKVFALAYTWSQRGVSYLFRRAEKLHHMRYIGLLDKQIFIYFYDVLQMALSVP
jgi:hypothetical protein